MAHSGLLRASGLATDTDVDLTLIGAGADGDTETGAVPHAELLTRFVDAAVTTPAELAAVRGEVVAATDEATMVDAAAVIAAFEMMTRIADGTGTTHPSTRLDDFAVVRDELHLDEFESARSAGR